MSAHAKRVKAARSYSIASDGDLRDRVNLGVLGKANAFRTFDERDYPQRPG